MVTVLPGLVFFAAMGGFDKTYDKAALIENFNEKRADIYNLKHYFNKIVPKYKKVDVEFKDDNEIDRINIFPIDTGRGSDLTTSGGSELKIGSKKLDSLLSLLGWTNETLRTLKERLDQANCISITSGEPADIGFKRSGMGMYFFNVFDKPMPDSVKKQYAGSCTYIYVNDRLVLEYGEARLARNVFHKPT
jgi:hypothetical protein